MRLPPVLLPRERKESVIFCYRNCDILLPQLRHFVTLTATFCYAKAALFRENTRFLRHKILHKSYKTYKTCNSLPPALDGGGGFAYNEEEAGRS